jgi:hypothetical protein
MKFTDMVIVHEQELDLPDLETGDELMVGKFKNSKATIKGFKKDKHNQPIATTDKGDQQIFKGRVKKLMSEGMNDQDRDVLGGLIFYHGGTNISGDTFDPLFFGSGEGRGSSQQIRPQGQGFYGADTTKLANIYQKYGEEGNQGTTAFRISDDALLYPKGGIWSKLSSEYIGRVQKALQLAAELLRERGLAEYRRNEEIHPMELYQRASRGNNGTLIRQALIDAGIDGSVEFLNDDFRNEIALYNPKILKKA